MKKYLVAPILYKKKNEIFQSVSLRLNKLLKEINIDFEYYIYGKKTEIKKFDGLILCGGGDIFTIKKNLLNKLRDNEEKKLIKLFLLKKKKNFFYMSRISIDITDLWVKIDQNIKSCKQKK